MADHRGQDAGTAYADVFRAVPLALLVVRLRRLGPHLGEDDVAMVAVRT